MARGRGGRGGVKGSSLVQHLGAGHVHRPVPQAMHIPIHTCPCRRPGYTHVPTPMHTRLERPALELPVGDLLHVDVHAEPERDPPRLIAQPRQRHVAQLEAGAVAQLGRPPAVCGVEGLRLDRRVDHCKGAQGLVRHRAAPNHQQERALAVPRHQQHATRVELLEAAADGREVRAVLPLALARVGQLVGELARLVRGVGSAERPGLVRTGVRVWGELGNVRAW